MEVIYAFEFDEDCYIFEIKYTGLPKTAPKEDRFKWWLDYYEHIKVLKFHNMTSTSRSFENGKIKLELGSHIIIDNVKYPISNVKEWFIPDDKCSKYE